jgi:hypothetical protein
MLIQKIDIATGKEFLGKVLSNEIDADLDKHYSHNQSSPSATWTITHNLGKVPSVSVIDSSGKLVYGTVELTEDNELNELTIYFNGAFSGKAYLN